MLSVIALTAALSAASAEPSIVNTNDFLAAYDNASPNLRVSYEEEASAAEQAVLFTDGMEVRHGAPHLYCQPAQLTLSPPQVIDMLRKTVKDIPALGDLPFELVLLDTLIKTFPCPK